MFEQLAYYAGIILLVAMAGLLWLLLPYLAIYLGSKMKNAGSGKEGNPSD